MSPIKSYMAVETLFIAGVDRGEESGASLRQMRHRSCPFCSSESSSIFGTREEVWVRCGNCRSVFRDITVNKFEQLHGEAWQDTRFVDSTVAARGLEPASTRWNEFSLPGSSLLEIGPGAGHLLAAAHKAGRSVAAVESSEVHREFIRETWGIHSLYPDIASVPDGLSFDAVVAINVLEHVYDIIEFLRSITRVLAPNGVLFVSTVNAVSVEATLLRSWWSMCKEHDHVSFPSPDGMARAAKAVDLRTEQVWSTELPFELPVSALVAARDWTRARRGPSTTASNGHLAGTAVEGVDAASKSRLARFYSVSAYFDPTSRLLAALGRAATVKARLRPSEHARSSS
jgi:2-polyprenyl-3-methyl-5-hydroxy-6-metoxy-1,4-benzoquinol methylase